jgi:hypothetical protein
LLPLIRAKGLLLRARAARWLLRIAMGLRLTPCLGLSDTIRTQAGTLWLAIPAPGFVKLCGGSHN